MAQQTAVEWLIKNLMLNGLIRLTQDENKLYKEITEQAKQIEKQQIIDAWDDDTSWNAKRYYKKTYEE